MVNPETCNHVWHGGEQGCRFCGVPMPGQQTRQVEEANRLRSKALHGVILDIAHENVGIYPQSVLGGDKPYKKRTERMEGWNDAQLEQSKNVCNIENWLKALVPEYKTTVEDLLLSDSLDLHVDGKEIRLLVNCSDTFFWGCSDAEEIELSELPALQECYRLSPRYGGELWVCRKRGMRPQTASYRECYPESEWHLFDAAGPERTDPDGKGRDKVLKVNKK
jgi:hypothetical protein